MCVAMHPMQLYVTLRSPYARLAHILVIEKELEDRVEICPAKTRTSGTPCYQINPLCISRAAVDQAFA